MRAVIDMSTIKIFVTGSITYKDTYLKDPKTQLKIDISKLGSLEVRGWQSSVLIALFEMCPKLSFLNVDLEGNQRVTFDLSIFTSLERISFRDYKECDGFSGLEKLPKLKHLVLGKCKDTSFLSNMTNLRTLEIYEAKNMDGLETLIRNPYSLLRHVVSTHTKLDCTSDRLEWFRNSGDFMSPELRVKRVQLRRSAARRCLFVLLACPQKDIAKEIIKDLFFMR